METKKAWFLLLALANALTPGPAAGAPAAARQAEPGSRQWTLQLEARGFDVEEAAVRAAVGRELARTDLQPGALPVRVQVEVAQGGNLSVRYRGPAGTELSRSIAAPARADEVPEASALLVGNLARDEAGALLVALQRAAVSDGAASSGAASAATDGPTAPEPPPAPAPNDAGAAPALPPVLPLGSVNLSLFPPLTLREHTDRLHLACELGLFYSHTAAISGLSLTLLGVTRVDGAASGAQIGLWGYWHGGPGEGLRVGGLFGVSSGDFSGLSVAPLATVHRGQHAGVQLSGLANISSGSLQGLQASGVSSYARDVAGLQVAGVTSFSAGPVEGAQIAALSSVSAGPVQGVQIAALSSVASGVEGLQISVVNVGGSIRGAQIGLVNVAEDVRGLQLGFVNVARSVQGQSLGFVPYNREGGVKLATWYNSSEPFNVGVRFAAGALYAMPTFAFDPGSAVLLTQSGARYSPGWSLGLRLPFDRAFLDLDVNYSQRARGWSAIDDALELRYRSLLGWRFMRGFAAFAGGGVRHHVVLQGSGEHSIAPEVSVGMELL